MAQMEGGYLGLPFDRTKEDLTPERLVFKHGWVKLDYSGDNMGACL
jgi:hypothetical protein